MREKDYSNKTAAIVQQSYGEIRYNGSTFTTKMDPESQAMSYPVPYPIWTKRNGVRDVEYVGGENDADNTVAIATLDQSGAEYQLFDAASLPIQFHYLGLAMKEGDRNLAYNEQFVSLEREAIAAAFATQLTDIPFMQYIYHTTIPQMENSESNPDDDAGRIGFAVWYQCVVQCFCAIFSKYNATMPLNDYLIKMGYNAEAPLTTAIFNLLKKQNLYSLIEQCGVIINQEFVDLDWFKEVNIINGLPSRLASDAQSPLQTVVGSVYVPKVTIARMTQGGTEEILFSTIVQGSPGYDRFNDIVVTVNGATTHYNFQALVHHVLTMLDPVHILKESRAMYNGNSTYATPTAYVSDIIECLKALVLVGNTFKSYTTPIQTFLMLLQDSTALNHWVYRCSYVAPSRPREQVEPVYFRLVADLFKAYGTAGNLVYDNTTKKWKVYTLWKGDSGIAEYDAKDGGFYLSTSVRRIPEDQTGYLGMHYMFPVLFERYFELINGEPDVKYQWFVNRRGFTFEMKVETLNASELAQSDFLAYLNPVGTTDIEVDLPTVDMTSTTVNPMLRSAINKIMVSIFGMVKAEYQGSVVNVAVNTDNIMYVGREFGSYIEDSLNYLVARAPLRQGDGEVALGFKFDAGDNGRKEF